ncbi:hypothetical protein VW23_020720 [Devosia insulae DS-56]|uniref:Uncharacterized protein n=2 Tax=Devosia insulae TaxID=408174 RepID=A0A1E5XPY8_9HYPH|nr:hypothetical protein VW23_020720 [Devosia insulae DS-56]
MNAVLVLERKETDEDGMILEAVVWRVPEPVAGSRHGYKYRLFFGRRGERLIGYDNERGKGDHKHLGKRQLAYDFADVPTLMQDFLKDVEQWKKQREP